MGIKYIRNTDDASIKCKLSSIKNKEFLFERKKIDKRNNVILSNGFTEITDEDIELLRKESKVFRYYESNKKLTVVDSLPHDSMSTEQLIAALKIENASLKIQLKETQSQIESFQKELSSTPKLEEDEELKLALEKALAKIGEQEKIIKALDEQLVALSEDNDEEETDENDQSGNE